MSEENENCQAPLIDPVVLIKMEDIKRTMQSLATIESINSPSQDVMKSYLSTLARVCNGAKKLYYHVNTFEKPIEILADLSDLFTILSYVRARCSVEFHRTDVHAHELKVDFEVELMYCELARLIGQLKWIKIEHLGTSNDKMRYTVRTPYVDPLRFADLITTAFAGQLVMLERVESNPSLLEAVRKNLEDFVVTIENSLLFTSDCFHGLRVRFVLPRPLAGGIWERNGVLYTVVGVSEFKRDSSAAGQELVIFHQEGSDALQTETLADWSEAYKLYEENLVKFSKELEAAHLPELHSLWQSPDGVTIRIVKIVRRASGEYVLFYTTNQTHGHKTITLPELDLYEQVQNL